MMFGTLARVFRLGIRSVLLHGLRSMLTGLGVLFGVASVIAMLAIGEGLSYDVQTRIQALGSNNIMIESVKPPESNSASQGTSRTAIYGITYEDARRIQDTLSEVEIVVPVREILKDCWNGERRAEGRIRGTIPFYRELNRYPVDAGRFLTEMDLDLHQPVCVLGSAIARELFPLEDPLGKLVKLGTFPFRVVGVMEPRTVMRGEDTTSLEDFGHDVYAPLSTVREFFGETIVKISSGSRDMEQVELHSLQVRVKTLERVESTAAVVQEIMEYGHKDKKDYRVIVPLSLLRDAERNKRLFNLVLGSIAGISLLVGGIGITNVMLATVTERTREIGVRRALGAKRRHIVSQFLVETVVLACGGGILGVAVGLAIPFLVTRFSPLKTIVTPESLVLSFGISVGVGLIFGLYPAWRAAAMDPVDALRHD